MELTTGSCFLSSKARALEGPVQEVPAGTGSCLGMPVNPAAVVLSGELGDGGTGYLVVACVVRAHCACPGWTDPPHAPCVTPALHSRAEASCSSAACQARTRVLRHLLSTRHCKSKSC